MDRADDFRELYALLHGAGGRYRSARATVVYTVDAAVAKEANRRFVDWRFAQGSPGMGLIGKPGPPEPEDFYYEYEDSEEEIRLWHQRPDRWREEIYDAEGQLDEVEVPAAMGGLWWTYTRHDAERGTYGAIYLPELPRGQGLDAQFAFVLDPSEYYFSETFWDGTTVFETGREMVFAGRECVEVRADTVSWGYPPDALSGFEGTADHLLLVDREVGTILRVAARLEGREFRVAEAREISYGEEFPQDTFRLALPGVEFKRHDLPGYERRRR